MAFVHPNPMDWSCWMYQMAHFSTWYQCVAMDLPGYGRSPGADPGLSMNDLADACWEAIDEAVPDQPTILVGCSVGSTILPYMYRQRPTRTAAVVLSGASLLSDAALAMVDSRIDDYTKQGSSFRWDYTLEDFSPSFRDTPMARYFATMFTERNDFVDVDAIIAMFRALRLDSPDDIHDIRCPTAVIVGSEDFATTSGLAEQLVGRIPGCELSVIPEAGHACHLEQPWAFDRALLDFLERHDLLGTDPAEG
jgi:3-oxoadipate enol-lactonase